MKIPTANFCENAQADLKSHMEMHWPRRARTILKKNKVGVHIYADFKICYKDTVIKTVWYWHKDRYMDH